MRTIKKRTPPVSLTQWRQNRMTTQNNPGMDCNYGEMRRSPQVIEAVEDSLFAEQGRICAYTGHRISLQKADPNTGTTRQVNFHIEHLMPQTYCKAEFNQHGEDTKYTNMVACWPRPNCGFEPSYGAKKKDNWPAPDQEHMFVSPLFPNCSDRFSFNHRGEISAANNNDAAAKETIKKIGLDHEVLTELRRNFIKGVLQPQSRWINLSEARRLLAQIKRDFSLLDQGQSIHLKEYCFVLPPVLEKEIKKLEGIIKINKK